MNKSEKEIKKDFLHPKSSYQGEYSANNFIFNTNLQEFAQKISYISSLHTGGKLSSQEAYQEIEVLWQQLEYTQRMIFSGRQL